MAHYIRTNHSLKNTETGEVETCKSINAAKIRSTQLQKEGNTIERSKKRTPKLHCSTGVRG